MQIRPMAGWREELAERAGGYAETALMNINQEFPNAYHRVMTAPGDFPHRPRERMPVFYGSYDWHSCVEMYWVLVRLLRLVPESIAVEEIKAALDEHITPAGVEGEVAFVTHADSLLRERPYGWAWALLLAHEALSASDPDVRRWGATLRPLADAITSNFLSWLPRATYPVRHGVHGNGAFAISRALPFARACAADGDARLLDALVEAALRWFADDPGYFGGIEPSGADFISPALAEAEVMSLILPGDEFLPWLDRFLPGLPDGRPEELFTPAVVSDSGDGYIAHLHGLNASRAWCWRRMAETLPQGDRRVALATDAAERHAEAFLPHVLGGGYNTRHWLACYAVLMLS